MALTLTTITVIDTATRDAQANAFAALIDSGTTQNIRLLNRTSPGGTTGGTGVLVTFTLDGTAAFGGGSSSGVLTLDVSPAISATASAGSATAVNTWEILDDADIRIVGTVTGSDTITSGQTVNLTSFTITWPAS
jgi:hypothetical protein